MTGPKDMRFHRRCAMAIVLVAGLGAGCGGGNGGFSDPCAARQGVVLLAWTLRGAPASATSCQGVDHVAMSWAPDACLDAAEVAPIPCALDRFRFERLAAGRGYLVLSARDAAGNDLLRAEVRATIDAAEPSAPAVLDLR